MIKNIKKMAETELIYGTHAVFEVLEQKRRKVFELFILESDHATFKKIQSFLPKNPIIIHKMKREKLTHTLGTVDHQGIGARVQPFTFRKKFFDSSTSPFLLLLDGIQDVRNLGAIIRSAYCTGVDGVILCKKKSATITATALKASAGLAERMEIYEASSIESVLIELKKAGYNLYVAALSKEANAFTIEYKKPLCLVIGSEGNGVSNATLRAGTIITLPQKSSEVSYNASVAAGILMSYIGYKNRE